MRTTHRTVLVFGLLLVIAGVFVVNQGPEILTPLVAPLGLVSYSQVETPVFPPTLLTVAPDNYTSLPVSLKAGTHVKGSLEVGDGREIAFYVMNEGNFSEWRAHQPSTIILAEPLAISANFTFTPKVDGRYYFVFDNQDSSRRVVIFTLSVVTDTMVLEPFLEYGGYELSLVGILLTVVGARTGRKLEPLGWRCGYCRTRNPLEETFCKKCGKSRE